MSHARYIGSTFQISDLVLFYIKRRTLLSLVSGDVKYLSKLLIMHGKNYLYLKLLWVYIFDTYYYKNNFRPKFVIKVSL